MPNGDCVMRYNQYKSKIEYAVEKVKCGSLPHIWSLNKILRA